MDPGALAFDVAGRLAHQQAQLGSCSPDELPERTAIYGAVRALAEYAKGELDAEDLNEPLSFYVDILKPFYRTPQSDDNLLVLGQVIEAALKRASEA